MDKQRILVVDDEPGIGMLCSRLLTREGHLVEAFEDPRQAVSVLTQKPYDLLLVDIRMPEVDGFEVIAHTQRLQPDCAILIMTGHGTIETAIRALRQGVDGLILKPFDRGRELLDAVEQAVQDNRRKRDAARVRALRPLFDVTERLLSEVDAGRLPALICEAIAAHLHAPRTGCFRQAERGTPFELLCELGGGFGPVSGGEAPAALGRQLAGAGGAVIGRDGGGDNVLAAMMWTQQLGSMTISRVERASESYLVYAARRVDEPPFGEVDLDLLSILARQAVVAMENAQLYAMQVEHLRQVRQSQQALIQAEKMAAAGRLTASIAHEVNNPLQSVQNCLHLAGRTDVPPEKRQEYFELANAELERLRTTVQRMLDFYRPSTGALDGHDLAEVVRYVLTLMQKQLAESGIAVKLDVPPTLPRVPIQSNQMQQVFMNLLLNAADAMPQGGEINVRARGDARGVELFFSDTGPGIPVDAQAKIFEPFFSTRQGGTGLGLTVSYNIVSAHGGTLEYSPQEGKGACFRIFLPSEAAGVVIA